MNKIFFFAVFLFLTSAILKAQTVTNKLLFNQGQVLDISMHVKTTISQQAMGQAIDFNVEATGEHNYKVTNSTPDNNTLHHLLDRVSFSFEGMGQKRNFDSKDEKDLSGPFGSPVKDMLTKSFDMIIDTSGTVLMALPEKIQLAESDSRMAIITNMLKDITDLVQPPAKGKPSLFKILPDKEVGIGEKWTLSWQNENGKFEETYTLSAVSDSTMTIDMVSNSTTVTKAEMMGNPTTTRMNNKSTGKITVDKATGILTEKNISTESNGTTESAFGDLPVTSKTITEIRVKPGMQD